MSLDNVIFPEPFRLSSRNPHGLTEDKRREALMNFQVAVFEAAQRVRYRLRPSVLAAGTILMRNVGIQYGKTGDQARTVPPDSSKNTRVRWSGIIEGTHIGKGALYTSLDKKGLLNEALRYSRQTLTRSVPWANAAGGEAKYSEFGPPSKDYRQLLVGRAYYTFRVKNPITLFDIVPSPTDQFFNAVESDQQYQAAKRDLRVQTALWKLALDPLDYTVSRPLGLSVLLGCAGQGLQVASAQAEVSEEIAGTGNNIVLGGDDGRQINFIETAGTLLAGTASGRPALIEIKLDQGKMDRAVIMPGSVVPIPPA